MACALPYERGALLPDPEDTYIVAMNNYNIPRLR